MENQNEVKRVVNDLSKGQLSAESAVDRLLGEERLIEVSMNRIIWLFGHMPLAIITAYQSNRSEAENRKRNQVFARILRDLGYGFAKVSGVWTYPDGSRPLERGFLIPQISKSDAIALAGKTEESPWGAVPDQEAIIWGSGKGGANLYSVKTGQSLLKGKVDWNDFRVFSTADLKPYEGGTYPGWKRPGTQPGPVKVPQAEPERVGISFRDLGNVQRMRRHWATRGEGLKGDPERLVILEMDEDVRFTRYFGLYDDKTTIGVIFKKPDQEGLLEVRYLDYQNEPQVNYLMHFTRVAPLFDLNVGEDEEDG